jgi:hypothetical protein
VAKAGDLGLYYSPITEAGFCSNVSITYSRWVLLRHSCRLRMNGKLCSSAGEMGVLLTKSISKQAEPTHPRCHNTNYGEWRCNSAHKPRWLYPPLKNAEILSTGRWMGPRASVDAVEKRKISVPK